MTTRRFLWAGWLVAALAAGSARQVGAQTLSLAEIEAKAQRDRPELAQRRAEIDRANAELAGVLAKTRPTLAARGELAVSPGGQLVTVADADTDDNFFVQGSRSLGQGNEALIPQPRYSAMLIGRWTVLDFGRSSFGQRAAEAGISAGRASLVSAKVELIRAARGAYLGWLEAHETWQLSHRDAEVTAARTATVRALIEEGARPRTDATLSSYDEKLARLRESRARRASDVALDALSATVQSQLPKGVTPELAVLELGSAAGGGAPVAVAPKPQPAAAGVGVKDPTLDVLQYQHDAALAAARAADKSSAPQLDLAADLGVSGQDSEVFPVYRAAVSITMPLYDGGAQSAVADQHRAAARGIESRRQLLAEQIRLQQLSALQALGAAAEDLGLTLELLATAEALLSEAEDHYRAGSDTLERVLSAQRSLVQARREVLSSKLDQARARLEVEPIVIRD